MGLIKWLSKKMEKLTIWDIACVKWSSILFGIIIGAYIADFTKQYLWYFIILAVLIVIKPIYKVLKNKRGYRYV